MNPKLDDQEVIDLRINDFKKCTLTMQKKTILCKHNIKSVVCNEEKVIFLIDAFRKRIDSFIVAGKLNVVELNRFDVKSANRNNLNRIFY